MSETKKIGQEVVRGVVKPEWIDINGHMNVAYYVLAFDLAVDALWMEFGITEDWIAKTNGSTFAVESHVLYKRELKEGEPYFITSELIAYDDKRVHQFQRMYHAEEQFLAATAEWMNLYVDLASRKVTAWPAMVLDKMAEMAASQSNAVMPAQAGKQMGIRNPIYAMTT